MKKFRIILGVLFIVGSLLSAHSVRADLSWTKSWSSSDDGSPFAGADIENIQNDIATQAADLSGTQTISGTKTFSGTVDFTGTVTGVGVGGKDSISRGFELVYDGQETVTVNPGTLYHGTTQVNNTAATHVHIMTHATGEYVTGTINAAPNTWIYIYCDNAGTVKADATAPAYADTAGNTAGTKLYTSYSGTYYRCVGAVHIRANDMMIEPFFQQKDMIMWDIPINLVNLDPPNQAWSSAISCATGMPSISAVAILGVGIATSTEGQAWVWVRPNGETWSSSNNYDGNSSGCRTNSNGSDMQRKSFTDSSQQIQYYVDDDINNTSVSGLKINVQGYYLNIR